MATAGLASSPAAGQEYVEGRFTGNYYDQMLAVAYIGVESVPYSTGARSGYDPYADPATIPTPIEGWQPWIDPNQPPTWQIQAPHDWESYGDYFGSLQGVIPPGRNWPLWLYRSLDAGLVYDGPTPLPTDIDTGVAAETQLVIERVDYTQPLQQSIETEYQLLRQQDGIYSAQQYPEFFTYYTQTNGEPGAFWARWQLPPERYWFSGNGTDMRIVGPGWNERQTLVVENWVVRGSTLFVVHADIKMHHDPSQIEPGVMRGWRSVTEDVLYQMVTSFVTYTYM